MFRYEEEQYLIEMLSYMMIAGAMLVFLALLTGYKATYGRYMRESRLPVPVVPAKWAWLLQELPSFVIPFYYLIANIMDLPAINALILLLFILHYFNRALIYPLLIKAGTGTPTHLFLAAFIFCTVNGYMQGAWHSRYAIYKNSLQDVMLDVIGAAVYASGIIVNIRSDSILRRLREDGRPGYKIPHGGLFEYISGANFFGECIEWFGYALISRTLPAFAFAFFTLCNLAPRAYQHHTWYHEKFRQYPKNRKAFIPFII